MSPSLRTAVYTVSAGICLTLAVPWSSLPPGTCLPSASAPPELLMENDTHGSELAPLLWHWHTYAHKHLRSSACVCVTARSGGRVWVVTAESQERLCRSGLSWVPGPCRIKGGITRQQPHVRVLSPGCCLSHNPPPPHRSPRGRIHVCLTYHWRPWLTQWLCVCLPLPPPVCLWSNDWLGPRAIVLGESVTERNLCIPFICLSTQAAPVSVFFSCCFIFILTSTSCWSWLALLS